MDNESREYDGVHVALAPIMTASTPATPGPSTPTSVRTRPFNTFKEEIMSEDIIPPIRPMSTPFPQQELLEGNIICNHYTGAYWEESDNEEDTTSNLSIDPITAIGIIPAPNAPLNDLPIEIHECILDHLTGMRASASSRTTGGSTQGLRSWGTALRHSRRREISELALVSSNWRDLIQDRLYRHLKIKGTRESIDVAISWFFDHPHLCHYVKHIEVWFPVFQQKNPVFERTLRIPSTTPNNAIRTRSLSNLTDANAITYQSPANNCTLEEVFRFIGLTFAEACILTLEGGERKKPPMVQHLLSTYRLPIIKTIRTLVCKGQWNLIRSDKDFQMIAAALPNLNEWHGAYAKPKSKSYLSMATILPKLPLHLTNLNICMEADYRRESMAPLFVNKVTAKTHFCVEMAKAIPTLEHLSFTGRVCSAFFDTAARLSVPRDSRLKSIDLIVKNCCRPTSWNSGSGVSDMAFILAFEALVVAAVKSLNRLAALQFLRIRFIDLGG